MKKYNINNLFKFFNINKATALYKARVLSWLILLGTLAGAGTYGFVEFGNKGASEDAQLRGHIFEGTAIVGIVVLIAIFMSEVNKKLDKAAANTALKYLKQLFVAEPDLKKYERVLSSPEALDKIATYIFNNLNPSEQKQIRDILDESYLVAHMINKGLKNLTDQEYKVNVAHIMEVEEMKKAIVDIVEKHEKSNDEFKKGLKSLISNLYNELYMNEIKVINQENYQTKKL